MTIARLNRIWLFGLIVAFLTAQWSTTHIHLAADHEHDGSHHQHTIEVHEHGLAGHHPDAIDTAHDASHTLGGPDIVELDQEYNSSWGKKLDDSLDLVLTSSSNVDWNARSVAVRIPRAIPARLTYTDYSTVRLRAPPQHA